MSESATFWHTFWPTLGHVVALLPAIVVFWASWAFAWHLDVLLRRRSDDDARLHQRVAYLEGRLLPFDEARRQRGL
jgi:hypothetical protein